jgi:hypothetical protein
MFKSVMTMEIQPGLTRIGAVDADAIRRDAERAGYTTLMLPEQGIVDKASFFEAVRKTLPLDPPLGIYNVWDALSDSLNEGLYSLPDPRIAILWLGTRSMETSAPADFENAVNALARAANSLLDPRFTCGNPKEVAVFVE